MNRNLSVIERAHRRDIWIDRAGLFVGTFLVALIVGIAALNALPELAQ